MPIAMKPIVLLLFSSLHALQAADRTWTGVTGHSFENPGNWSTLPADILTDDLALFGPGITPNHPQLTASRCLNGLRFTTPAGSWNLGGPYVLTIGSGGVSSAGQNTGVNGISADLALGAAQTWQAGSGGLLSFTGSLAQTGGFIHSIGNTSNNGSVVWNPAEGKAASLTGPAGGGANLLKIVNGGNLVLGESGALASLAVNTTVEVVNASAQTWSAPLYGSSSSRFVKQGGEVLTLSGVHAFARSFGIQSGTLALGPSASLTSNVRLELVGGVLNISAVSVGFTLAANQTLAGSVTVTGPLTFAAIPSIEATPGSPITLPTAATFTSGAIIRVPAAYGQLVIGAKF